MFSLTIALEYLPSIGSETLFLNFNEPRNRFQGIDFASQCSLAGRYDNLNTARILDLIDYFSIPAQSLPSIRSLLSLHFPRSLFSSLSFFQTFPLFYSFLSTKINKQGMLYLFPVNTVIVNKALRSTEAGFFDVIRTQVLRVFLLAIHSHLY